jgi:hypothetical protein
MFEPVTRTKPWKSMPSMTCPAPEKTLSPVTTVRRVPAGTPVLPALGLPPMDRGLTEVVGEAETDGADADGDGEATDVADALASAAGRERHRDTGCWPPQEAAAQATTAARARRRVRVPDTVEH